MTHGLKADWTLDTFTSTIHRGRVALWSWDPAVRTAYFDDLGLRFWGGLSTHRQDMDDLFALMDERDREEASAAWIASADSPGDYEYDFRVPQGGSHRWISARGVGGEEGRQGGSVLSVFVDVTSQREAADALETLVREMGHRISNLFGVASAVTTLAAREAASVDLLADELRARFADLRNALTFAVKRSERGLEPTPLGELIDQLLASYRRGDHVTIEAPIDVLVGRDRITDIALIVHELATNSVKYGALGDPDGRLRIEVRSGDMVQLSWQEDAGRPVSLPEQTGFGSMLVDHTVRMGLGGTVDREVGEQGLTVRLMMDRATLSG